MQRVVFTMYYRAESKNVVADVLNRRNSLLTILHFSVTDFEKLKQLYKEDDDFGN